MLSAFPNVNLRGGPGEDQREWQTCLSTTLVPWKNRREISNTHTTENFDHNLTTFNSLQTNKQLSS